MNEHGGMELFSEIEQTIIIGGKQLFFIIQFGNVRYLLGSRVPALAIRD
jgi:hypothetical protein